MSEKKPIDTTADVLSEEIGKALDQAEGFGKAVARGEQTASKAVNEVAGDFENCLGIFGGLLTDNGETRQKLEEDLSKKVGRR